MKRYWMMVGLLALLTGCGDGTAPEEEAEPNDGDTGTGENDGDTGTGDSEADTGSGDGEVDTGTGDPEPLEIEGTYTTEWGETITITADEWTNESEWGTFVFSILSYDNDAGYLIAQDTDDDLFDRFEWTVDSDTLYFCQSLFDGESEEAAGADENVADAEDLDAGCGGYAWSALTPA